MLTDSISNLTEASVTTETSPLTDTQQEVINMFIYRYQSCQKH